MPTLSIRTWLASLLTLISLTLLAAPLHRQPVVSGQSPALTNLELAHIAEIRHLMSTYAVKVWPGWESGLPPLLFRKGAFDYLIGHPDPPPEFEAVANLIIDGEPVFRLKGHITPAPVATAWQVGDRWAATTPVRDEFQAAVDELLGEGIVVLDDASFIRAVVHEAFHAYQMNYYGGMDALPELALMGEPDGLSEAALAALELALVAEGQALNEALADGATAEEIQAAITEFLRLRAERRADLPADVMAFESAVEWMEGAARYCDTRLMLLAGSLDYVPSHEAAAVDFIYPRSETTWEGFRAQLSDVLTIPGGYRDRLYVLGAAQMLVLDRLTLDWQARLLGEGVAVEALLAEYALSH